MHIAFISLYFTSLLLTLPLTLCSPQVGTFGGLVDSMGHKDCVTCSANQKNSIADFTQAPEWTSDMLACLQQMNNTGWNGAECKPAASNGAALGPSFGFWKGNVRFNDGQECFDQCAPCLAQGINWHEAVTTSCQYMYKDSTFKRKTYCTMGFDYGT